MRKKVVDWSRMCEGFLKLVLSSWCKCLINDKYVRFLDENDSHVAVLRLKLPIF